jgi:DNA-3-methyladenine glycosylase
MNRFSTTFFERDTLLVTRDLLGATLVRMFNGKRLSGTIVEVEAYIGYEDSACHASRGRTPRTTVMFGPPGQAYVYFTYGMHHMLNVVTETEGFPAAVLVRAIEPLEGIDTMRTLRETRKPLAHTRLLTSGPGRLTQALAIDRQFNNTTLVHGNELWLEPGAAIPDNLVQCGPRIGIASAAEKDRLAPWRLWVRNNPYVSR